MFIGLESSFEVTYLVDVSEASSDIQLKNLAKVIKSEVSGYKLGDDKSRVSIVTYGENPEELLSLKDGNNIDTIYQALSKLRKRGGKPDLERAVRFAHKSLLEGRYGVPKILVVIAASKPSIAKLYGIKKQMAEIKKKGVKLIIVGLDKSVLSYGLEGITNVHKGGIISEQQDLFDVLEKMSHAISQATGWLL